MSEIELILTKLKIVSEEQEQGMYLCDKEHSKLLLDYITNLQYKYENQIHRYMNLKENTTNLQEENERLKEELKSIKSNYKIQLEYDENLQERIDEAIDYLQQEGVCIMNKGMNENERLVWDWHDYYYLLDILKGELE